MASTDIERRQGNTVALTDEHYLSRLPDLAEQLSKSGMCPEVFKGKPDDIAIVGYSLADNGLRLSINTLPQCYVVHGRPGYMAQIQTAMAAMHGVTIRPVGHLCDEVSATVEVLLRDGTRHEVTFTLKEAEKAGLTKDKVSRDGKSSPSMYKLFPTSMLVARATTRAISWYCPAVKLGLAGTVDMDELDVIDIPDANGETGEIVRNVPPMSVAPSGATIPESLREPAITDDERAHLIAVLEQLPPDVLVAVQTRARELAIPNLKSNRVTKAHGVLVAMLIQHASEQNPIEQDGVDSPARTGIPARPEVREAAQARSHDLGGADEAGQEPSDTPGRGTNSISAAPGPDVTDQPTLYGPDEEPFT